MRKQKRISFSLSMDRPEMATREVWALINKTLRALPQVKGLHLNYVNEKHDLLDQLFPTDKGQYRGPLDHKFDD